jgi:hypothetical protein
MPTASQSDHMIDRETRKQTKKFQQCRRQEFFLMEGTVKQKRPDDEKCRYILQSSSSKPPTQSS